ncbi:hypothetical protein E2C01_040296 [Portunus trituberculatus]|uniref:Uncharacterized protein n=1 Tax=Portunus trituberculatus TaxID=210409 RepID=A0A5B7FMA1_PORTR|nr:hypothetical protein [Portunus trituberculatus]
MCFACISEFLCIKRWNTSKSPLFDIFQFLTQIVRFPCYSEFCCIKRWNNPK